MSFNGFGRSFEIVTFGESHGPALGVVLDGIRPGVPFDLEEIQREVDLRRPGTSRFTTPRKEADRVHVLSGVFEGQTTGAPICLVVYNETADPSAYDHLKDLFRPGHADLTFFAKYGIRDHRGGGRASGRETVARVAAGAVARALLVEQGIDIRGFVREIGGHSIEHFDEAAIGVSLLRCPDVDAEERMAAAIDEARAAGDSLGGVVEIHAKGVPAGWGDPVFAKLDAQLAAAMMSIGAVKGVEIGDGFDLARAKGSESNDEILPDGFASNRQGGVLGGISSGADIVVRVAVKPTPSIRHAQRTVGTDGTPRTVEIRGRHDPCICPRLVPVAEAMVALVLVDAMLRQRAVSGAAAAVTETSASLDRLDRSLLEIIAERRSLRASLAESGGRSDEEEAARVLRAIGLALGLGGNSVDAIYNVLDGEKGV